MADDAAGNRGSHAAESTSVSRGKASHGKIAVLYDGGCTLCRTAAEELRRFDNSGALELIDLHDPQVRSRFPDLKLEDLLREIHVVDDAGRIFRGARAINEILRHQHGIKHYLAYLWYLPGFPLLAEWQYKMIATSRHVHDGGA